jgi:hypothetical protein
MRLAIYCAVPAIAITALSVLGADTANQTADPLGSLKAILKQISADGTKERVVDFTGPGKWRKRKYLPVNLQFDVKKTDSLVSPFVASVTWSAAFFATPDFPTREEAASAPLPSKPDYSKGGPLWWAKLAFQDGRWIVKDVGFDLGSHSDDPLLHQRYSTLDDVRRPILDWWLAFGGDTPEDLGTTERKASEVARQRHAERMAEESAKEKQTATATKPSLPPVAGQFRIWKDTTGKYSVTAKFVGVKSNVVTLQKMDLTTVDVPLQKLGIAERKWIKANGRQKP